MFTAAFSFAQKPAATPKPSPSPAVVDLQPIRSSPAYAELLLHKAELDSTLESLLVDYTEQYPKVKEIRLELVFLKAEMDRLLATAPSEAGRLSQALGRMMLRKVEIETALDALRAQYKDDHPEVRKLRRKLEIFEASIKEVLGP
jgi:uncharacterized protein involved in exopolysaccharide biosynthesis